MTSPEQSSHMVVLLLKETPRGPWEFVCYCVDRMKGHQSAAALEQQERHVLGKTKAKAILVWRDDFEAGRLKELAPPKGWKPDLPSDQEVREYAQKKEAEARKKEADK